MQSDIRVPDGAQADRSTNGRYKAGNSGGPGNPFAGQVNVLRKAILECVTKEDIQGVFKRLVTMAQEGHWQAAKLVLSYTIGKPQPMSEADELQGMLEALAATASNDASPNEPSTNGVLQAEPSTNRVLQEPEPSTNGVLQEPEPSTNGILQTQPSTNGELSTTAPVLTHKERRALRRARRLAKLQS
jgi:hypothetical protein